MGLDFFKKLFSSNDPAPQAETPAPPTAEPVAEEQDYSTPDQNDQELPEEQNDTPPRPRRGRRGGQGGERSEREPRRGARRGNPRRREDDDADAEPIEWTEERIAELDRLEQFVLYVAKSLVSKPEALSTSVEHQPNGAVVLITCDKPDTGKLIGRGGSIIASIRTLVSGAASRSGLKATVDIVD